MLFLPVDARILGCFALAIKACQGRCVVNSHAKKGSVTTDRGVIAIRRTDNLVISKQPNELKSFGLHQSMFYVLTLRRRVDWSPYSSCYYT